jgi:hypothetical protein
VEVEEKVGRMSKGMESLVQSEVLLMEQMVGKALDRVMMKMLERVMKKME